MPRVWLSASDMKFLVVDGFNLIRRIFEARHAETESDMAEVVQAAGQSLNRALTRHNPTHAAVVLEHHDRTWRHLLYPEYKQNRSATPELLVNHLDAFEQAFQALGVSSCSVPSYEADDVIATIARVVADHDGDVVILSTDKVYLQLIGPHIEVFDHFNEVKRDAAYVTDQLGIPVEQYIDYLALVGDKSNNVKGVQGIGPKSALQLLSQYKTLDNILQAEDNSGPARKVQQAAHDATRSRQLVTLKTDVELGLNIKSFRKSA